MVLFAVWLQTWVKVSNDKDSKHDSKASLPLWLAMTEYWCVQGMKSEIF